MPSRFALPLVLSLLTACASAAHTCRVGAECASGVCTTAGVCLELHDTGPLDAGLSPDGAPLNDANVVGDDAGPMDDAGVRLCSGNGDGFVSREEVPLRAGLHATFRVAQSTPIDTTGGSDPRTWDLSGALSGDADARVDLLDPSGAWWSADFPTATYAAQLSASSDNLGVFQVTDTELLLLGVVSPMDGLTRTNLAYDPPVTVLAFPLGMSDTWMTTSTVTGQALGVFGTYTETYTSVVDAAGTLVTPLGTIENVLRVRTDMERTSGLVPITSSRTFAFVAECFGTAATITSQPNETHVEFTTAAEVRRLAP